MAMLTNLATVSDVARECVGYDGGENDWAVVQLLGTTALLFHK